MEGSHQGGQALKNGYLYQGDFAELDEDVGWTDFELRNYDAQLGRWIQQDPFAQFHSPYSGMGNDPVNLIDPSGGVGIPCQGTSQLALFFMKAGEVALNALNTIGSVSTVVSNSIQVAGSAANIYNRSLQYRIISQQLVGNATGQVGKISEMPSEGISFGSGQENLLPPIFWEEFWFPSIEAAGNACANSFYANASGHVIIIPEYPNIKFLLFHYENSEIAQQMNGKDAFKANKNVINPDSGVFDKHEVPYKSTKEGGRNSIMFPVNLSENRGHGAALSLFYKRFNLQDGDPFLVPIYLPTVRPVPARDLKPSTKPEIKYVGGSPFEALFPFGPRKITLIRKVWKYIFAL